MSMLSSDPIDHCHNRFFGAALRDISNMECLADHARWCDSQDQPTVERPRPNTKWRDNIQCGTHLRARTQIAFMQRHPTLKDVYDNPIWDMLKLNVNDVFAIASFWRQKNSLFKFSRPSYQASIEAQLRWRLGTPDWSRIAYALALLLTSKHRYAIDWLLCHFSDYMKVASIAKPYQDCFPELQQLVDDWLKPAIRNGDQLVTHIAEWPKSYEMFQRGCAQEQEMASHFFRWGWPLEPCSDGYCRGLLWVYHLDVNKFADELESRFLHRNFRCPESMRRAVRELDNVKSRQCGRPINSL